MRVILRVLIILLFLGVSFVVLMPSLFDVNNYKKKIQNIVYEKTGNILEINGAISLSIFPVPSLKLDEVKYYKNKEDILFNSKTLVIVPEIISFIKGNIVFKSIKLIKPLVILKVYSDKSNNWSNAASNGKKKEVSTLINDKNKEIKFKGNSNKKSNPLNIKSFIIKDAQLSYINNEQKYQLKNLKLSLKYLEENNYIIDGHFNYNLERMSFSYEVFNRKPLLNIKGFINSSLINFSNKTELNIETLKGRSTVSLYIEKINNLFEKKYIISFPLDIKGELNFSNNNIELNNLEVISKNTKLNGIASYKKVKNIKNVNLEMHANQINLNNFIAYNVTANKKNQDIKNNIKQKKKEAKSNVNRDVFNKLEGYNIFSKIKLDSIQYKGIIAKNIGLTLNKKESLNLKVNIKDIFNGTTEAEIKYFKNKKMDLYIDTKNIEIKQVNNIKKYNYLIGDIDLLANVNGDLKNINTFKSSLNGEIILKNKNTSLNNINLGQLKNNILNIKKLSEITDVSDGVFKGSTKIKGSKNSFTIRKGVLKLPNTEFDIEEGIITAKGNYNIDNNKINMNVSLDDKDNLILSLFKIKLNGNLNNISTKVDYDNDKIEKTLEKALKKKMQVIIKKKLDKKFNNLIENLLD
ncbi:AsmA family protein [Alphaproteobacteria bacterium]|nr:AsmA family protein [Alphaproteobacteria bacterium]